MIENDWNLLLLLAIMFLWNVMAIMIIYILAKVISLMKD